MKRKVKLLFVIVFAVIVVSSYLNTGMTYFWFTHVAPIEYQSSDGGFKGYDGLKSPFEDVKFGFDQYKIKSQSSGLTLYRCTSKNWWYFWDWYAYLNWDSWQVEYHDCGGQ
jgi:hypothetical protein